MNKLNKTAIGIAISLTLAAATAVYAHPGQMDGNMHQGMQHDMKDRMQKGMGHDGDKHAKGHGEHGAKAAQSLATPEERSAMQEKMRTAKTPEERQQIASANRSEMQKRAAEKGISMPEHRGEHGRNRGNEEHKH